MNICDIRENLKKIIKESKNVINKDYMLYCILGISIFIFICTIYLKNYNGALLGIIVIWLYSICYAIVNLKNRFLFLLMNLMIFTFILDRPVISFFRGNSWWYFSNIAICKSLTAIMVTEVFLLLGTNITEKLNKRKNNVRKQEKNIKQKKYLIIALIVTLIITGITSAYVEIAKYIRMKDVDYALIYTTQVHEENIIIRTLAAIFPYAVFAYLATMPDKKNSNIVLILYILLGIPGLLLGSRNSFVLRVAFAGVYYLIRDTALSNSEKWISFKMKMTIIIIIPVTIVLLGAYNYIRSDEEIIDNSPVTLMIDFFYKQGTSFDTVCQAFEHEEKLRNEYKVVNYTLGDILDYVIHNTISQKIFNTEDLGNGNSIKMVEQSNSMAHKLSYIVLGEQSYLSGHGRGTSYIIETYMDGGMIWLAIYSALIGAYLSSVVKILKRNNFVISYIVLTTLSQILLLPRYSASGFLTFLFTPQFLIIIFLYLIIVNVRKERAISNEG